MKSTSYKISVFICLLAFVISGQVFATGGNALPSDARVKNYAEVIKDFKYPKQCKKKAIEGNVMLRFLVNETGDVKKVEVLCSGSDTLSEACRKNLENLKFIPARNASGEPIATWVKMPIRFELN